MNVTASLLARAPFAALVATLLLGASGTHAADQGVFGRKLLIKNPPSGTTANKVVHLGKDPNISLGAAGSAGDPQCAGAGGGGTSSLRVAASGGAGDVTIPLPCTGWTTNGANTLYKYKDSTGATCNIVLVKNGVLVKAVCKGTQVGIDLNGSMSPVAVVTTLNSQAYCTEFAGTAVKDGGDDKTFLRKDAAAPASCAPPPCPIAGQVLCSVGCVDLATDPNNCGECENPCPAGVSCTAGACGGGGCPIAGQVLCSVGCVDLATDPNNCGECENPCPAGVSCTAGACGGGGCPIAGQVLCSVGCVDLATDPNNCGECENPCPAGVSCTAGACGGGGCPIAGQVLCSVGCVDLATDPDNCGACDNACAVDQFCTAGVCGGGACPGPGEVLCAVGCVDVATDPNNCGACGNACAAGESCTAGVCALAPKLVFVTSTTGTGQLSTWTDAGGFSGLFAADTVCRARAVAAGLPGSAVAPGLPGSYMAWLSSNIFNAASRLTHSAVPYVLPGPGGAKVADDWADLTDGSLDAPINRTEFGVVPATPNVWTGTDITGGASPTPCLNWTTTAFTGDCGSAFSTTASWTTGCPSIACFSANRLYCLQQ